MLNVDKMSDNIVKKITKTKALVIAVKITILSVLYAFIGENFLWLFVFSNLALMLLDYNKLKKGDIEFKTEKDKFEFMIHTFGFNGGAMAFCFLSLMFFNSGSYLDPIAYFQYLFSFTTLYAIVLMICQIKLKGKLAYNGYNPSYIALVGGFQSISFLILKEQWSVFYFLFGTSIIEIAVLIYMNSRKDKSSIDLYFHDRSIFFIKEHFQKNGIIK